MGTGMRRCGTWDMRTQGGGGAGTCGLREWGLMGTWNSGTWGREDVETQEEDFSPFLFGVKYKKII